VSGKNLLLDFIILAHTELCIYTNLLPVEGNAASYLAVAS